MATAGRRIGTGRYTQIAIVLHWLIALAVVVQVCIGWYMNEALPDRSPARATLVGIHISLGVTILLLVLARIVVRLVRAPPPLPPQMPRLERALAALSHLLFYGLLLALPLTGWAIVSLRKAPISFWGLPWPRLPMAAPLGPSPSRPVRHELSHIHVYILIWILVVNFALHVGAAIYHQVRRPGVLWRMTPGMRAE